MTKPFKSILRFVKLILKGVIVRFTVFHFFLKFRNLPIVIFDIDNTLCDTESHFSSGLLAPKEVWSIVKPFNNMIKIISEYQKEGFEIVYLTARPFSAKKLTKKWLIDNNLPSKNLYLSTAPEKKILFLSLLKQKFDYYDDLSFSPVKDSVQLYTEIVDFVNSRENINYYGYMELIEMQGKE